MKTLKKLDDLSDEQWKKRTKEWLTQNQRVECSFQNIGMFCTQPNNDIATRCLERKRVVDELLEILEK